LPRTVESAEVVQRRHSGTRHELDKLVPCSDITDLTHLVDSVGQVEVNQCNIPLLMLLKCHIEF
jgi:hypothetical protein